MIMDSLNFYQINLNKCKDAQANLMVELASSKHKEFPFGKTTKPPFPHKRRWLLEHTVEKIRCYFFAFQSLSFFSSNICSTVLCHPMVYFLDWSHKIETCTN